MLFKTLFLTIILSLSWSFADCQSLTRLKNEGSDFLQKGQYAKALDNLERYWSQKSDEMVIARDIGICHYQLSHLPEALRFLEQVIATKEFSQDPPTILYLARTYHALNRFKDAAIGYKTYLSVTRSNDPLRRSVVDDIRRCSNGIRVNYPSNVALVENLGSVVNSEWDEFAPILSPNYTDRLYFSSARQGNIGELRNDQGLKDEKYGYYRSDMFLTRLERGEWTDPRIFNNLLNSPRHDVLLDINSSGKILYYFKGLTFYSGEMLIDTFRKIEERTLFSENFIGPVKLERGDQTPFFFNDTLLIFASQREGGYGGYDLYVSQYSDQFWSTPENLGPQINSSYDELAPFLASDGRTLYFSSNNLSSIGGLDVFNAAYSDDSLKWSAPVTCGIPVNSSGDDSYFRLTPAGDKAYFSSSRKEGLGQRDIYVAIYPNPQKEQSALSYPVSFYDLIRKNSSIAMEPTADTSSASTNFHPSTQARESFEISPLSYTEDNDILGVVNIQHVNKWITLLKKYPQTRIVITGHSDAAGQKHVDLYFTIKRVEKVAKYMIDNGIAGERIYLKSSGSNYPVSKTVLDESPYPAGGRYNRRIEAMILENGAPVDLQYIATPIPAFLRDEAADNFYQMNKGLSYKVQVTAIKRMYDTGPILTYPHAMIESSPVNNVYIYTLGLFKDYSTTDLMKKNLVKEGILDAVVVPYVNGVRINVDEARRLSQVYPDLMEYLANVKNR